MKELAIVIVHGFVGWLLCGAVMGIGMAVATPSQALLIHAIAAPIIFAGVSMVYYKAPRRLSPRKTALVFTAEVVLLDVFVVALMVERSFLMFTSPLGTWIPFALIFLSSWATGIYHHQTSVSR